MSQPANQTIFGSFEHVSMPQFGIRGCVAKIDTGAYSGALHCSRIKEVKRPGGKRALQFIPSDNKENETETEYYEKVMVRSSNGKEVQRFLITTEIEIQGRSYPITIGLSNREKMQREILIGRRFLRENGILVDVRINQELDMDGGEK